jgi:tetratricopeptide (TPR) repeat protein
MERFLQWASEIFRYCTGLLVIIYLAILHIFGFAAPARRDWPVKVFTPPFTADKLDILGHLRRREFSILDRMLTTYEKQTEKNVLYEFNAQVAFRAFAVPDQSVQPLLEEWIKGSPNSYAAHLALGEYFKGQGFRSRGSRYANQTSEQQFAMMEADYKQAIPEVTAALKLDTKLMEGYCLLMKMAMAMGDDNSYVSVASTALHQTPSSFVVREQIMRHLQPRWGGSETAMAKFANDSQVYIGNNPELAVLEGYVAWNMALGLDEAGKSEEAIRAETEALKRGGDYWEFYHQRGRYLAALGRWPEALRDLNRANLLMPQDADVLHWRAFALSRLGYLPESLDDIRVSSTFEPPDQYLLGLQTWVQARMSNDPGKYTHMRGGTNLY